MSQPRALPQLLRRPRLLWLASSPPHPPALGARDWGLLGALIALGLLETVMRPELSWSSASLLVVFALMPTVLWRRSRPLLMLLIAFGAMMALSFARQAVEPPPPELFTSVFLLMLPYALLRWGSGRAIMIGLPSLLLSSCAGFVMGHGTLGDFIGGLAFLSFAMALGAAFRYRARARTRELEQVKLREREQLARDLHDTVAHHVSAIAIRAQAGLATAQHRPEAAIEALGVIETEASRTLAEMRAMVRLLRRDEAAELSPGRSLDDLLRLARPAAAGPEIEVDIAADLGELSAPIMAALYRLAQESITNARCHARHVTRIEVGVTGDEASVRLRVSDDGERVRARSAVPAGFGLIGMRERAELLGGRCEAGPNGERGWTVTAILPRQGATL